MNRHWSCMITYIFMSSWTLSWPLRHVLSPNIWVRNDMALTAITSSVALPCFPLIKHVQSSADHISQLNPPDLIRNVWWLRDASFLRGVTHICHRICQSRQPKVAPANVSKCKVPVLSAPRDKGFTADNNDARARFTSFSLEERRPMRASPVIDIWLGQFTFCPRTLFSPSDNLVALSRASHKGEPRHRSDIWSDEGLFLSVAQRYTHKSCW